MSEIHLCVFVLHQEESGIKVGWKQRRRMTLKEGHVDTEIKSDAESSALS